MAFEDLTPILQTAYELNYEFQAKTIILFGWFIFSLFYVFYLYKSQKPTPYILVGTFRAAVYAVNYVYMWLFFLLYPVVIHPAYSVESLLIFVASVYSILITVFSVVLIVNFTLWIPKYIFSYGKIDIKGVEQHAINNYLGYWSKKRR